MRAKRRCFSVAASQRNLAKSMRMTCGEHSMKWHTIAILVGGLFFASGALHAVDAPCRDTSGGQGETRAVIAAAQDLQILLTQSQRAALSRPYDHASAIR